MREMWCIGERNFRDDFNVGMMYDGIIKSKLTYGADICNWVQ